MNEISRFTESIIYGEGLRLQDFYLSFSLRLLVSLHYEVNEI